MEKYNKQVRLFGKWFCIIVGLTGESNSQAPDYRTSSICMYFEARRLLNVRAYIVCAAFLRIVLLLVKLSFEAILINTGKPERAGGQLS